MVVFEELMVDLQVWHGGFNTRIFWTCWLPLRVLTWPCICIFLSCPYFFCFSPCPPLDSTHYHLIQTLISPCTSFSSRKTYLNKGGGAQNTIP